MKKMPFPFELEKFVPFCVLVKASYQRDQAEFVKFSPVYGDGHQDELNNRIKMVQDCINPRSFTIRMKTTTESQNKLFGETLALLDKVERYLDMAGNSVAVTKKDLDIAHIRVHCHSHNAAGTSEGLKNMTKLLGPYIPVLEPLGYTKELQAQPDALAESISRNKETYNSLLNERMILAGDNVEVITKLWDFMKDIMKTGKTIYRKDPVKINEYTQSDILKRLEHQINPAAPETNNTTA